MTRLVVAMRDTAARVDTATPARRDRAVDALRAFAVLGVVLGHWLVTALVADGRTLRTASPLQHMPWLAPVSWTFQTLAVFFLVGGHVATRSYASARERGRRTTAGCTPGSRGCSGRSSPSSACGRS